MPNILVGLLCDICEQPINDDDYAEGFKLATGEITIAMHGACINQALIWAGKAARKEALAAKEAP